MNQSYKRILVQVPAPPLPANTGSKQRILGFLNYLAERKPHFKVDVISNNDFGHVNWSLEHEQRLLELVDNIFIYRGERNLFDFLYSRSQSTFHHKLLKRQLPIDSDTYTPPSYVRFFQNQVAKNSYDFIVVNYLEYAHLVTKLKALKARTIIDIHDLSSEARLIKQKNFPPMQGLFFNYEASLLCEADLLNKFNSIIVNSEHELEILSSYISKEKLFLVPHLVNTTEKTSLGSLPYSQRSFHYDLLFVGSHYQPNVDAINFFLKAIFPKLVSQKSDINLVIAGSVNQFVEIESALKPNITVLGYVPNLSEVYLSSKIFICPLLDGVGTKVKLIEAMSYSLPIVTTSIGASGLNLDNRVNAFIVNEPHLYADSILHLLNRPDLAEELSTAITRTFESNYSTAAIYSKLDLVLGVSTFHLSSITP